ncbi:shikimate dehydrogenase [Metallumcola ferriviriculae]|uniref:Shikimate dehydrogenase (NADP(+)) n=1 Tax=Metallumcola ferriviriculae TaxID=3039180 RepID=A0AAU0US45_9FIRM|nr:shikimate dehydrogenase [Desulfitibacteraceae bacterium MK1]
MKERISGTTKIVGLLGWPVEHSFSPAMHNAVFEYLDMDYAYIPFPVPPTGLARAVRGLFQAGVKGVNVTVPHKVRVMDCLDEIDPYAQAVGAVNTVTLHQGRLQGYNTDGAGFIASLAEAGFNPTGKRFLLLGAGGAARAAAFALVGAGADKVFIANRTFNRAEALAGALPPNIGAAAGFFRDDLTKVIDACHCLVNTTSVGMYPHAGALPIPAELIKSHLIVADLVYNPVETELLIEARARGCRTVSGLGMLIYQGAASFKIWTGREAPVELMLQVLKKENRQ